MEDRLKECPFCENGWVEKEFGVFILWHKPTCIFGGPEGVVHSTRLDESFVTKWNTRTIDPLVEKMVEALTILSSCWFYGNWIAETYNERKLQHIMEDLGYWPTTEDKILERVQEYRERRDDTI